MGQHSGRVKPGMGGGKGVKSFGKPSEPSKSTRPRTSRTPGGAPAPLGKGPLVRGISVTRSR